MRRQNEPKEDLKSIITLYIALLLAPSAALHAAEFYVAPTGNDASPGTKAKPFLTLERARDEIRAIKTQGALPHGGVTVWVSGGNYFLKQALVFTPEDSGTKESPITYSAISGETPVVSGGVQVSGWRKLSDGHTWAAFLPEVAQGAVYPAQLFINGERRQRARHPSEGYLKSDDPPRLPEARRAKLMAHGYRGVQFKFEDDLGKVAMGYKAGDIRHWDGLEDVNLFQMHSWTSPLRWIAELDEARRTVLFTGPSRFPALRWKGRMPYYFLENAREFLDSPGEWYLDRKTGVLTYWPREGEDMALAEAIVSARPALIRIEGVCAEGRFVDSLVFRGLSFRHTDWGPLDRRGETDGYSCVHFLPAAIEAKGLRFSAFERCEITLGGGYGIYLVDGSAWNCLQQCEIHDMGGGGVLIGSRWATFDLVKNPLPPDDAPDDLLSHHNVVDNCFFHDNGCIFPGVIGGVFIAHAPFNRVTHNEICNLPYSGVTVGRRLDFKYSHAHHNEVAFNHIHHIGAGALSDMGGIYTEGVSPGTRLHHNLIHDVNYFDYGAFGIYCDQGSSQIQIDHNVCYDCMDGGYMQNGAIVDNVIRNNIFTLNTVAGQINNGFKSDASMIVERNIIDTSNGEVLSRHWDEQRKFKFNHNLYHSAGGELRFGDWSWQEWQALGQDRDSIVADPMFFDRERHDFRLRSGSPAENIGFEPVDLSSAGLYGEPEWVSAPGRVAAQVFRQTPAAMAMDIKEDFENTPVGERVPDAVTTGEAEGVSARVTDVAAATGKRSLEFIDGPAGKTHYPYIYYKRNWKGRKARLSFDLRMGQDAVLLHEWRGKQQEVGPSLRFEENGSVTVNGKMVARYPLDEWFHVRIECEVAPGAHKSYSLTLTAPGQAPETVKGQPFKPGGTFDSVKWIGWISPGQESARFYLDNLEFKIEGD